MRIRVPFFASLPYPSRPLTIRAPCFLLFGFNKGPQNQKGQKGTTTGGDLVFRMGQSRLPLWAVSEKMPGVLSSRKKPLNPKAENHKTLNP